MKTSKFRETLELKMGNPEPNLYFLKNKGLKKRIKKDRCRDSMEAVLTNEVDYVALVTQILL